MLDSFTFPSLGTNCDAGSIFLIEIDKTFLESADHVPCLNRLRDLDCQKFHWIWGAVDFIAFGIVQIFDIRFKMTETWAIKLNLVPFINDVPLANCCCLCRIIIRNYFSNKLILRNFTTSTK